MTETTATTALTALTAADAIKALTAKGRETMTAIGLGNVSFFDEGIQEHSGIWGSCLTQDMGHKSSGVINRLRDLGLFATYPAQEGDDSDWWALTALGAEVANLLAAPFTNNKEHDMSTTTTAPATTTEKETPVTETPAKKTVTKQGRAYTVPKGYVVKWQHGGHDLLGKVDAKTEGPAWWVSCNEHGDLHEAKTAKEAEQVGALAQRSKWCKGDHKAKPAATKAAPAKTPAKKTSPAKSTIGTATVAAITSPKK